MQTLDNFMKNHQLFLDYLRMFQRMTVDKIIKVEYVGPDNYHVWYEDKERAKKENLDNSFKHTVSQLDLNQFFYYQMVQGRQFESEYQHWRGQENLRKMREGFEHFINSGEAQTFFDKKQIAQIIRDKRAEKVHGFLESGTLNMDQVINRLIKEHDYEYQSKCMKNGYEPYPNQKLDLLFHVASVFGTSIDAEDTKEWREVPFATDIYLYRNYYFVNMWGQGVASFVLNLQEDRLINL